MLYFMQKEKWTSFRYWFLYVLPSILKYSMLGSLPKNWSALWIKANYKYSSISRNWAWATVCAPTGTQRAMVLFCAVWNHTTSLWSKASRETGPASLSHFIVAAPHLLCLGSEVAVCKCTPMPSVLLKPLDVFLGAKFCTWQTIPSIFKTFITSW